MNARKLEKLQSADEGDIFAMMTKSRHQARLTQDDMAKKMNTTASAVARLESGGGKKKHSPSVRTLNAYANGLGCDVKISFVPRKPVRAC